MKKKVFRERRNNENKGFTFTVDETNGYKKGAIEKVIKRVVKKAKKEDK